MSVLGMAWSSFVGGICLESAFYGNDPYLSPKDVINNLDILPKELVGTVDEYLQEDSLWVYIGNPPDYLEPDMGRITNILRGTAQEICGLQGEIVEKFNYDPFDS